MNERQAIAEGYQFTGIYNSDKEVVKQRALELKKQGNKVVVTPVKANPLSRGQNTGITGYSVYMIESEENKKKRLLESECTKRASLAKEKDNLYKRIQDIDMEEKLSLERTLMIVKGELYVSR